MQVKLLNPDGSPAADAQAVAIMKPGVRVDANLKELPSFNPIPDGSGTSVVPNALGTLQFDSKALAVLAQSPSGFAFIPLPMASREVKLRPWAKLQIDLSTVAPKMRKMQPLTVVWENCFAGYPPQPKLPIQGDDPFGTPASNVELRFDPVRPTIMTENNDPFGPSEPKIDWRFDPLVMWSLSLEAMIDQVVNVPPGEVSVFLSDGSLRSATSEHPVPAVRYSPVRTLSGKQATFKTPEVENIRGQLVENSLPEWNKSSDSLFVIANRTCKKMPEEFAKLFTQPSGARDASAMLDELARRYASDLGMRYRYELLVPMASARVNADGNFELADVPVGMYDLELFGPSFHAPVKLIRRGEADNKAVTVELTGKPSPFDVGEVERAAPPREIPQPPTNPAPPVQQPFQPESFLKEGGLASPIEAAEKKIKFALSNHTVTAEFAGLPFNHAIEELSSQGAIPIRINYQKLHAHGLSGDNPVSIQLPAMTLQSALRNTLSSLSDELAFTIRDEVLMITTKEDAARDDSNRVQKPTDADLDSGDTFLEHWSKNSLEQNAAEFNQVSLRRALKEHLEKEFDTKQQARRAELDRLRSLLKQSEEWLNTRQERRAEIVGKKVDELVEKARK